MIYQFGTALSDGATSNSYQWNFNWQFTTGLSYTFQPGLDLDLGYKCLSTPNTNFNGFGPSKPLFNHTAELGLVWRFSSGSGPGSDPANNYVNNFTIS